MKSKGNKPSDSIIELLNYTRKESYRPLHLSGSIEQTCTVYLKRHISISFPQKSYHTKKILCSNINVSLNLGHWIPNPWVSGLKLMAGSKVNCLSFEVNQMSTRILMWN